MCLAAIEMKIPKSTIFIIWCWTIITIQGADNDVNIGSCVITNTDGVIDLANNYITAAEAKDIDNDFKLDFPFTGDLAVSKLGENLENDYVDVTINDDKTIFSFSMNEKFTNLDTDTPKQDSNKKTLSISFHFQCNDGSDPVNLAYTQNIIDTNNNVPTFSLETYEILAPMPLLPKFDLTALVENGIIATDVDFSNKDIIFTMDNPNFVVSSKPAANDDNKNKDYRLVLQVNDPWPLKEDTTFKITATDSGVDDPKSITVDLTIKIDSKNSVGILSFPSALYTLEYSEDADGNPTLSDPDPSAIVVTTTDSANTKVEITYGNDDANFAANYDPTSSEVKLTALNPIKSDVNVMTLKLSATLESTTVEAVININFKATVKVPAFGQAYYEAVYKIEGEKATVEVTGEGIKLEEGDGAVLKVSGEYEKNFLISNVPNGDGVYTLSINEQLPNEILLKNDRIVVVLDASLEDKVVTSVSVIVTLPPKSPEFVESLVFATYTPIDDGKSATVDLDKDNTIALKGNGNGNEITITGTYAQNFKLAFSEETKLYTVTVDTVLDDSILNENTEILIQMETTVAGAIQPNKAQIMLKLPKSTEDGLPQFNQPYYEAVYKIDGDKATVDVTGTGITLERGDGAVVKVSGEFEKNFLISNVPNDDGVYTLSVNEPLPNEILLKNDKIVVVLDASLEDKVVTSVSVIVTLPPKSPEFVNSLVFATYTPSNDGKSATVDLDKDNTIALEGGGNGNEITITGTYATNFKLAFSEETKSYTITVDSVLDDSILIENTQILIPMETTITGAIQPNKAQIMLKLPKATEDVVPQFGQTYYTGSYTFKSGDQTADLLTMDVITITNENADKTEVLVDGKLSENFVSERIDDTTWKLTVQTELNPDDPRDDIVVHLKATLAGSKGVGVASVVISLSDVKKTLKFTQNVYKATYKVDPPSVAIEGPTISVTSPDDVTAVVTFKDSTTNFKLQKSEDQTQWVLDIAEPLNEDQLKEGQIILELVAHQASALDGGATLLIQLPQSENEDVIAFVKPFYEATYKNDGTAPEIDVPDKIVVTDPKALVDVQSDYEGVFDIACDSTTGECTLTTKGLPDDVLEKEQEIILVLEAAVSADSKIKGRSTVILALPLKTDSKVPKFTSSLYEATYSEKDGKGVIASDVQIKLDPESDQANVEDISVDDDTNFVVQPSSDGKYWELQLKEGIDKLPKEVVENSNEIVLKLTVHLKDTANAGVSSILVKLPKLYSPNAIEFTQSVYTGKYQDSGDPGTITDLPEIKIVPIKDGADLTKITVDLTGDYKDNFEQKFDPATGVIALTLKSIDDTIKNLPVFQVGISAKLEGETSVISSAVVIELPGKIVSAPIKFDKTVYTATYTKDNVFTVDGGIKIDPIGEDVPGVTVATSGDYSSNFKAEYDEAAKTVAITLTDQPLPSEVLEKEIVITVNIQASVGDVAVLAGLAVKLPKAQEGGNSDGNPDSDNTGLVAGIAVLAVLLAGFIVGTGAIYFIKRRRNQTYNDLDDFRANAREPPPKRRATGFVRYELDNETDQGPPDTDVDAPIETKERRKSVVFDENVETLPIEARNEEIGDDADSSANEEEKGEDDVSEKSDRDDESDREKEDKTT